MKHFREFPAYNFTSATNRNEKICVVFCVPGINFSSGFVNNWTSLLFSFEHVRNIIEPHFVNYNADTIQDTRNLMLCGDDRSNEYRNLFYEEWNYDLIFFIDSEIEFFDPNKLIEMILIMKNNKYIDILTHSQNSLENFDLKFTIFRKRIFERIKYPWFEENKNIDKLFIQKLVDMKLNIQFDQSIKIE